MSTLDRQSIETALSRLLKSESIRNSPRLAEILRYLVREELEGRGEAIKAYSIGVDVLDKPEAFDPQNDPIVRVTMGRLRNALELHYARDDSDDCVLVTIPKGTYRPEFTTVGLQEDAPSPVDDVKPAGGQETHHPHQDAALHEDTGYSSQSAPVALRDNVTKPSQRLVLWVASLAAVVGFAGLFLWLGTQISEERAGLGSDNIAVAVVEGSPAGLSAVEAKLSKRFLADLRASLVRNAALSIINPEQSQVKPDLSVKSTVQKINDRHRVSVELTNDHTGVLVWARNQDLSSVPAGETLSIAVERVAQELRTQIFGASKRALEGLDPNKLTPTQLFVLATWVPGPAMSSLEWEKERVALARLAVAKDPTHGPAYSVLADKLAYLSAVDGPSDTTERKTEAQRFAAIALELAPGDANTLFNIAQYHWHSGQLKESVRAMARVVELDANHAIGRMFSRVYPYTCKPAPDRLVQWMVEFDRALDPVDPIRWVTLSWISALHLNRGELNLALEADVRAAQIFQIPYTVVRHAAILNQLGLADDAGTLIRAHKRNWPNLDVAHFSKVTISRLCAVEPDADAMLTAYHQLAEVMSERETLQ